MPDLTRSLRAIRKAVLAVAWASRVVAGVAIFGLMLAIIYDVVARYIFVRPSEWVFPVTTTGVLAVTFLAIPDLYARREHISVDLVYNALPRPMRLAASVLVTVVAVVFGVALTWYGFDLVAGAYQGGLTTSGLFNLPLWLVSAPIPFAGALLALVAVLTALPPSEPGHDGPTL